MVHKWLRLQDVNYSSWPVKTKTQVSVFIQQQSGSHHSVSPEHALSAAMVPDLVRCSGSERMCGSEICDRQSKDILVADVEEQSMLAAKTGAKAKTAFDGFRSGLGLGKDRWGWFTNGFVCKT